MKRKKIKTRHHELKNALILVILGIAVTTLATLLSSFFIRVNAKEKMSISEFSIPTTGSWPMGITKGSDNNLWFTESSSDKVGKISLDGAITEFSIPRSADYGTSPRGITTGPDGNLWFTEFNTHKIGRFTPSGTITEYSIPTRGSSPSNITTGPDGNLWFTESYANNIGRITLDGIITEFPLPTNDGRSFDIATGPDGNLWFTEHWTNKIGKITPSGEVTEFSIPTTGSWPLGITTGIDGNLWFTEFSGNKIGRITPNGIITEFLIPTDNSAPYGITSGPDGNLWFTENYSGKIGRITPNGEITEFSISTPQSWPMDITTGQDGNLWFTEYGAHKIGRVNLSELKDPGPPDRDFSLLAPFNNGVTWTVSSGYFNNRNQTSSGCHIGTGPDHCRNQLFGLDMVPNQQTDTAILAPGNGKVEFKGKLPEENCIGLRITLDNGLNLNVCHFISFNVSQGERIARGKVLGTKSTPHVHLSLDDRYRIGTLCPGKERCFLPIPFDGQHTIEGMSLDPDPSGETVILPYSLCDQRRNISCQFKVGFQQYKDLKGTSSNTAIP